MRCRWHLGEMDVAKLLQRARGSLSQDSPGSPGLAHDYISSYALRLIASIGRRATTLVSIVARVRSWKVSPSIGIVSYMLEFNCKTTRSGRWDEVVIIIIERKACTQSEAGAFPGPEELQGCGAKLHHLSGHETGLARYGSSRQCW